MRFDTLPEWLAWQENLHFTEVDPGLDRISQVWRRLNLVTTLPFKVVTVAGTNGKGSSVAMLDSILRAADYKTGTYTSPHLLHYNERIMVNGQPCSDDAICRAFEQIDQARGELSLTYFEFATLAAVILFCDQKIDIAILEVGMGGRLDAVNLFDADIALITPISLDHTQWLGQDRETIAFEKAGIIRQSNPVVCSEFAPAASLLSHAKQLKAPLFISGQHYHYQKSGSSWHWSNEKQRLDSLVFPALVGDYQIQNAAAVLEVVSLLGMQGYIIKRTDIEQGLTEVKLAGRFQKVAGQINHYFDVTHNEQGAENLAHLLVSTYCEGRTIAVLGMLKDKNASAVSEILNSQIALWYVGGLSGNRGLTGPDLSAQIAQSVDDSVIYPKNTVAEAYTAALEEANPGDRILVFGSFHTVETVMLLLADSTDN
jgi:dihydrofolate synthase/folylpolyglutamate synthase